MQLIAKMISIASR